MYNGVAMFNVLLQTILPHHALSRLMLRFLRVRWRPLKAAQINFALRRYNIDLAQAANPEAAAYPHFNAFFTRALRPDARPIYAPDNTTDYISPADGAVSAFGAIDADKPQSRLTQAKGIDYSLLELLGGQADLAERFHGGHFATIYLSPRDYHRVHMPAAGALVSMVYIPGRLFSVSDSMVRACPNLFNRNERVVCVFDTARGALAVVLVGALFVGCIETTWAGVITPPRRALVERTDYAAAAAPRFAKGAEMGRFNMGSTVIALLPRQAMQWEADFAVGAAVKMGRRIAAARG